MISQVFEVVTHSPGELVRYYTWNADLILFRIASALNRGTPLSLKRKPIFIPSKLIFFEHFGERREHVNHVSYLWQDINTWGSILRPCSMIHISKITRLLFNQRDESIGNDPMSDEIFNISQLAEHAKLLALAQRFVSSGCDNYLLHILNL